MADPFDAVLAEMPMKLDRGEVERLLGFAHKGFDSDITHVTCGDLAALCRLALEVMDAPVGRIEGRDCKWFSQRDITHLLGQRVRLVRVQEG